VGRNGKAPTTFIATSLDKKVSRPMYMYPKKLTYVGADTGLELSYGCK